MRSVEQLLVTAEAIAACRNLSSKHELSCREVNYLQFAELSIFRILPAVDHWAVWRLRQSASSERSCYNIIRVHRLQS